MASLTSNAQRKFNSICKSELAKDRLHVVFDGLHGNLQVLADFLIRMPSGH